MDHREDGGEQELNAAHGWCELVVLEIDEAHLESCVLGWDGSVTEHVVANVISEFSPHCLFFIVWNMILRLCPQRPVDKIKLVGVLIPIESEPFV